MLARSRSRFAAALTLVAAGAALAGTHALAGTDKAAAPVRAHAVLDNTQAFATARIATAKYATDLAAARADGWNLQITPNMPGMGFHFLNPSVTGFDPAKPPILVYEKHGSSYQLGALEWVFTSRPATPPLTGAHYGSFPAACHYADGNFIPTANQKGCAATEPDTGAAFTFWHPRLITLHVWIWYPNPDGFFASTNPLVKPFTGGDAASAHDHMDMSHG